MDVQGHGTAHWESLEHWALDEILKIVELRDGRRMNGPPELKLQDFVGKRLRVRYEEPEHATYDREKRESGTFVFTITSIQVRDRHESGPEIQFGIAPHEVSFMGGLSTRYYAVRIIPQGTDVTTLSVTVSALTLQAHGHSQRHKLSSIMVTNLHVLWD